MSGSTKYPNTFLPPNNCQGRITQQSQTPPPKHIRDEIDFWKSMCINQMLNKDILTKYSEKIDWDLVSEYQVKFLTFNEIMELNEYLNWKIVMENRRFNINELLTIIERR